MLVPDPLKNHKATKTALNIWRDNSEKISPNIWIWLWGYSIDFRLIIQYGRGGG